jgi:hypothetical protein
MPVSYPWASLGTSYANDTAMAGTHPPLHNSISTALNELRIRPVRAHEVVSGDLAVTVNHGIACYSGTGGHTFTMPAVSALVRSRSIVISNVGSGPLTIARAGSDTFGKAGLTSMILSSGCAVELASDGTSAWYPIGEKDFIDYRWDDLRIAPTMRTLGGSAAALANYNSSGIYALQFASGNEAFSTIQLPHGWDKGTMHPHVHWKPSANITSGSLTWTLEYIWSNPDNGSVDSAKVTDTVSYSTTATAWQMRSQDFAAATWANAGASAMAIIRLALTANTTGQNPFLVEFDFHIRRNRQGTINAWPEP